MTSADVLSTLGQTSPIVVTVVPAVPFEISGLSLDDLYRADAEEGIRVMNSCGPGIYLEGWRHLRRQVR